MEPKSFRHASLFTGIGGFDLAASWMGWQNVFQCEIEPFCQKVLKHHFPQCEFYEDIRTSDFSKYHGTVEIITGGFPCQPFSVAGKRKGTDDDRFLWSEMYRALREVQPRWVVAENVCGLLTLQSGVVFERVCADLENAGYAVQPFIIPACAVGAPHRRDRVWIVANADSERCKGRMFPEKSKKTTNNIISEFHSFGTWDKWENNMAQSPVCNRNDGISFGLADITFSKWRKESIKALGNAIVPAVVYQIFKAINEIETNYGTKKI